MKIKILCLGTIVLFSFNAVRADLNTGLVAYYPFNGNANDASGHGNNGVVNGATLTADRFGQANTAYAFAGSPASRITIPSTNLLLQPGFSFSGWVNFTGGTENPRFFSTAAWEIGLFWPGTTWPINFNNTTTAGLYDCPSVGTFTMGTWHHVVAVRSTNAMMIYIDGQLHNAVTVTAPIAYPGGFGTTWLPTIGGSWQIGYPYDSFAGAIDDIRIYSRALTYSEVTNLYWLESSPPNNCAPAPSGLVAWWRGEGNGLDSADGNNGALTGGVAYTSGVVGQAFNLNGTNAYLNVPSSASLKMTGPFTAEAWIRYLRTSGTYSSVLVVAKGIDGEGPVDWAMGVSPNYKLRPHVNVGGTWVYFDCATTLNTGVWYHVAMVYGGTNLSGYVNGVLDGSQTVSGALQTSDYPLKIGAYSPVNGIASKGFFPGQLDEVSLYKRALAASEIAAIYAAGGEGKCGPSTGSNYSLVLPVGKTGAQGEACSGVLNEVLRYQNVYGAAQFPAGRMLIKVLRFRPCNDMGAFSTTISNIQIRLSTTAAQPDALNTVFNNNVGADDTIVYQGALSISSSSTGTPKNFDIVVPLTQPFLYDPAAGNLLLEVRNFTGAPIGNIVDHADSATDASSRAYSYNASATTASYLSTGSAIVQLIYSRVDAGSPVPVITSFTPAAAVPGANVTITGLNFSPTPANNIVFFGAVRASVLSASATSLTVRVPAGATYGPITVNVGGLVAYSPKPFNPTFPGSNTPFTASSFAPRFDLAGGDGSHRSAIADLDGDGKPDIAVANAYGHTISLYRNISTAGLMSAASFAARVDLSAEAGSGDNPYGFATADVDGDGKLDLVACDRIGNNISVYRNVASPGSLTAASFATRVNFKVGTDPRYARVADVDGDGRPDIVSCNYAANTISILRNLGTAGSLNTNSFAPRVDLPAAAGPYDVAIADLDGDGKPDLAVVNNDAYSMSVYRNIGTADSITTNSFAPRVVFPAPNGSDTIAAGDVDGDGKLDLVIGSYLGTTMSVYRNQSTAGSLTTNSLAARVDFATGNWTHTVALGDLNGDSKVDIASVGELPSYLSLFRNLSTPGSFTSASLAARVDYAAGWNGWGVSVGDLDGDSRPDVIFCNAYDDNVSVYQNVMSPTSPTNTCTTAPAGLVSWWRAEGNALDSVDGNNGTLLNGATFAAGMVGQAFALNITNATVRIPASTSLNVGTSTGLTVECWIKPTDVTRRRPIVEWNTGVGSWGVHFYIDPDSFGAGPGALYANVVDSYGSWHQVYTSAGVVTNNAYQHVAFTYDKATGVVKIYRNGVLVKQQTVGSFTPRTSYDLYLGYRPPTMGETYSFLGLLDEPSLYNRALSDAEIQAIYAADGAGKCTTAACVPAPADMISWWRAEGNALDSVDGNNGTLLYGASFAAGMVGQAFNFNSATQAQAVRIPYAPSLITSNFSVEAWIKPATQVSGSGGQNLIFGQGYGHVQLVARTGVSGVRIAFQFGINRSTFYDVVATNEIPIGQFSHAVGTWDGITLKLYINGVLRAQRTPGTLPTDSGCPFFIGGFNRPGSDSCSSVSQFFNGAIDEVSYYRRALSASEVFSLYAADGAGKCPESVQPFLLNMDFQGTNLTTSSKTGFAALGLTTNDFWNFYSRDDGKGGWRTFGSVTNLLLADRTPTTIGMTIANAPGAWASGSTDPMYNYYIYPFSGNATITVTNLPAGAYDVLPYSTDGNYEVTVGAVSYGIKRTRDYPLSNPPVWTAGVQYARFTNVQVSAGQPLVLTVRPGLDGAAIIAGLQIAKSTMTTNPPPAICVPAPSGLISWWRGESNALDSVDGNNGSMLNGATFGAGRVGTAFNFDGTNDHVRIPDRPNLRLTNALTIEAWVFPKSRGSHRSIITKWNAVVGPNHRSYTASIHPDGRAYLGLSSTGYDSGSGVVFSTNAIPLNQWTHLAMTYDGGFIKMYVNGAYQAQTSFTSGIFPGTNDLSIGGVVGGTGAGGVISAFAGMIDEPSIYCRALSASEIRAIFNAASAGKCIDSIPPVIVTQPTNRAVNVGATATFAVTANGSPPLSYQWYFGSNALAGATAPTLMLTNVQTSQAGLYHVVVSNLVGVATSSDALLYVNQWPVADASATDPYVVVCNTSNAAVVLNGTRSYDPDGDPLQYAWSESGMPLATGVVAVVTLPLGLHPIELVVNDGMAADTNGVTVKVVNAIQAIADLIAVINASDLKHTQPLIVSLEAASASIERCNPIPAANQLEAFQNKVRAQVAPDDPVLARTLIDSAQEIINSLENCCGCEAHKHGKIKARHGNNGRVHLNFEGSRGRCYVIEASSDLVHWEAVGVATDLEDGTFEYQDSGAQGAAARFYRVVTP